jgi:hypothetical protein
MGKPSTNHESAIAFSQVEKGLSSKFYAITVPAARLNVREWLKASGFAAR